MDEKIGMTELMNLILEGLKLLFLIVTIPVWIIPYGVYRAYKYYN